MIIIIRGGKYAVYKSQPALDYFVKSMINRVTVRSMSIIIAEKRARGED